MFAKTDIEIYFTGEKKESLFFLIAGAISILAAGLLFLFVKMNFYQGAAVPLLLIGLLLATVGYTVYQRSDADRIRNAYAYDMNPSELTGKELPRMKRVMKNFVIYRYAELFLLAAGIALYLYFIRDIKNDYWRGFGLSLALLSLVALLADYFAERRGKIYTAGLESFAAKK